jgi:ribosomal protein L37E
MKKTKVKSHLVCRACGADWENTDPRNITQCPFCGKRKDARHRTYTSGSSVSFKQLKDWCANDEQRKERYKKNYLIRKKRLFFKISGSINPVCVRCGCDDIRLLEVNHKNGGGGKELADKSSTCMHHDIISGRRPVDDLEPLCRACNAIHYLELKYGPLPMKVIWKGEIDSNKTSEKGPD